MRPLIRAAVPILLTCSLACAHAPGPAPAKREPARRAEPSPAAVEKVSLLPARKFRVRVYTDEAYRSQNGQWEERIRRQLGRATDVTVRRFRATFELVELKSWSPGAPPSGPLRPLLEKLEALDPGQDVDLVLGYTSALPAFTATQDQLGLARALGRHVVLRGMESPEEDRALRDSLSDVALWDRDHVFQQRRTNKEVAIFLHEWGHLLGAPHSARGLMYDDYDRKETIFTEDSLVVISIGLLQKPPGLDDPEVRAAWAKDISAWLDTGQGKALAEGARKYLAELAAAGAAGAELLNRTDQEVLALAVKQDHAGQRAEAAATLAPLLERHPKNARLHAAACQVQIHASATNETAWALCRRAAELDPKSSATALFVADLAERRKDPSTPETLARARAALEAMKEPPREHWLYLADLHRQREEVSLVELALARGGDQSRAELADWAGRTRRWVGLVPGAVPPEGEAEYVAEFRKAQAELEDAKYARARERIAGLEKRFGGAVGALTLRCELQIRQAYGPRGLRECRQALERYPESVHARYLLGMALSTAGAWPEATAMLERVVELDPTLQDAWSKLSEAYRAAGNARAAAALRERYEQRFGKPPSFK